MPNTSKFWKLLRRGEPVDLKLFKARFDYYKNLRNNVEQKMVAIDAPDAVAIVALNKDKKAIMVRQYRFGIEADTIELPGGIVDPGEDALTAAKRELKEETGYTGGTWSSLDYIYSNPVYMNSKVLHFLATDVEKTDELKLDDGENIEVLLMDESALREAWKSGLLRHPHSLMGLLRVFDLWKV